MTRVIDADGHICEPHALWDDYVERAHRNDTIRVERDADGQDYLWINGEQRRELLPASACIPDGMDPANRYTWDDILPGSHDGAARVAVLDQEGIERSLLFPSLYLLAGDIARPKTAAAACNAYNRWIADMCAAGGGRLHGVGIVPLADPTRARAEVDAIAGLGLAGVCFRPERYDGLALSDARLDPFWDAVQGAGLFAAVHGSFGSRMPSFATARYDNMFFTHMICHPFEQMAAVLDIICGGVLDRHRGLKVAFLESGLGWLDYWLGRMDEHFEVMGGRVPGLKRRPSEQFRAQCAISIEADEARKLPRMAELGLIGNIFWGADYPHYDCTFPGAATELTDHLAPLDAELKAPILYRNAARLLGLD